MEERLQKFAQLVEAGSFTKAAARLHISQPALTTAVKKLERELKAELVTRSGHTFVVTEAGRTAYQTAKEMSSQTHNLKLRLSQLAGDKVALNLGMIDSIAGLLFIHEDNLPALEQTAHLSLIIDNSARLIRYVEQDDLDAAFVAKPPTLPPALSAEPLGDEPLVLVTQASQADQVKFDISRGQLKHFLSYNQNAQTYSLIAAHFEKQGVTLHPTFYSTSPEIMLQIILTHQAVAVLPYLLVKNHLQQGKLVKIATGPSSIIARQIVGIHRTGRILPDQAGALMDQTRSHLAKLVSKVRSAKP